MLGQAVHEDCVLMWEGQTVAIHFESSGQVVFDLHGHSGDPQEDGTEVYLYGPEYVSGVRHASLNIPELGEYCLNWVNQAQVAVRLRYTTTYSGGP